MGETTRLEPLVDLLRSAAVRLLLASVPDFLGVVTFTKWIIGEQASTRSIRPAPDLERGVGRRQSRSGNRIDVRRRSR